MATQFNKSNSKKSDNKPEKAPPAKAAAKAPAPPAPAPAKAAKTAPVRQPTQEEISTRAFEIYVSEGCKEGSDLENWLRAEKELSQRGPR
jgi:hypothetical protein